MESFVARQPIFDRDNKIYGYELLYRNSEKNVFDPSISDEQATFELLVTSYFSFGMENLIGQKKAFINFDKALLMKKTPVVLDSQKIVVELLETIVPDEELYQMIMDLKKKNYTIALDDFRVGYPYPRLIQLADIIKVDFTLNTKEQIRDIYKTMRDMNKILLAEKVENQEVYEWAKDLGFDYFQGYFFSRPSVIKSRTIKYISTQDIQILKEMSAYQPNFEKISSIIESEPKTAHNLIEIVNANVDESYQVSTIYQALNLFGVDVLRKCFALIMVQKLSVDQSQELVKVSMQRAKFFELLGEIHQEQNKRCSKEGIKKDKNEMMLVGALSTIDIILGKPMVEVIQEFPLSENIKKTLLMEDSPYLDDYKALLSYEKGDFDSPEIKKYSECNLTQMYVQAVQWAEKMIKLNWQIDRRN